MARELIREGTILFDSEVISPKIKSPVRRVVLRHGAFRWTLERIRGRWTNLEYEQFHK